jgi:hypothetical protein
MPLAVALGLHLAEGMTCRKFLMYVLYTCLRASFCVYFSFYFHQTDRYNSHSFWLRILMLNFLLPLMDCVYILFNDSVGFLRNLLRVCLLYPSLNFLFPVNVCVSHFSSRCHLVEYKHCNSVPIVISISFFSFSLD